MSTKVQSLQEVCDVALAGFDRTLYGYKGNVQYATFQPPPEILKQLPEFKVDDAKERWVPVRTDARLDRLAVKKRHHIVPEPDWEPPVKKPKFFYPPSKGMKLRSVAELNQEQQEIKNMSSEEYDAYRRRKNMEVERSLTMPVVNKPPPPPAPVGSVQAILDEIAAASRPRPFSAHSNTVNTDNNNHKWNSNNNTPSSAPTTSSTVRKDRLLVNALRTKKDERLFKKPAPAPPAQRKGSSSSTSSGSTSAPRHTIGKRPVPIAVIHKRPCLNLLTLKLHLTDDAQDKTALRKIADLVKRKPGDHLAIDVKKRPKLIIHLRKPERLRRLEKVTMLGKYKVRPKSTSESKAVTPKESKQVKSRPVVEPPQGDLKPVAVDSQPKSSDKSADEKPVISASTKSTLSTTKSSASAASDSVAKPSSYKLNESRARILKPTKESMSTPTTTAIINKESSVPATPATPASGSEKLKALTGTVTADFLKTIKIPKRKPKTQSTSATEPGELEEGETISPSPSPSHGNAREIPSPSSPPPPPPAAALPPPPPPPPSAPPAPPAPPATAPSEKSRERSRSPSRSHREGRSRYEEESKKETRRPTRDDSERKRPSERRDEEESSGSISSKKKNGGRYRDHSSDDRRRHRRDSRQSSDDRHRHRSRSPSRSHGRSCSESRRSRSPHRRSSNISRTRSKSPSRVTTAAVTTAAISPPPPPPPPPPPASVASEPVYKNATSPDADSDEQCKMYAVMFRKLATAYKHRGDPKITSMEGLLDHMQALLNYVLSFYYQDLNTAEFHGFRHWESLYPFTAVLLKHLSNQKEMELYAVCTRMMGMVRYYTFVRRAPMANKKLDHLIIDKPQDKPSVDAKVAAETAKASKQAFNDFEEAHKGFKEADRYLNYEQLRRSFPTTFKNTCLDGEYGPGIVIGGEAGTSIEPQYPFVPFAKLHHAAIVSKCLLAEYIEKHGLKYNPIQDTDEYM